MHNKYIFRHRQLFHEFLRYVIDENVKRRKIRSFVLFVIIGIIGLLITELCMYIGVYMFGQKWYLVVKIFTAGIVLLWNYAGRKVLIFKGVKFE